MIIRHSLLLFVLCIVGTTCAAANQPNVLIVITDEHNFRTLGCYRDQMSADQAEMWGPGTIVKTPHIDRLADEGVICTRAYATAPVCTPSRAAMITGLYPHNTGAPQNNMVLNGDVPTLAKILNADGYRSSFVGKWHLGGTGKPEFAPKVDGGFQDTASMFNRGHWKKFSMTANGPAVGAKDKQGKPSYNVGNADEKTFSTDFLTDRVLDFINRKDKEPFFAVVSYPDPHGPNTVRAPYDRMYDNLRFLPPRTYGRDDAPVPGWLGKDKNHPKFLGAQMSKYFGMVKCLDDNFGRILNSLEAQNKLDSTIILLTSDHGDLCYEHNRLNKGNPYEGSARVPMLIRYPAALKKTTVYRQPFGTVDITPTVLGLANVKSDAKFEGRNLSQRLQLPAETSEITFLRNAGTSAGWLAAVDDRYKLIISVGDKPWLFDAEADPDEILNFYGRPGTADVTQRLAKALLEYTQRTNDPYAQNAQITRSIKSCSAAK